MPRRIPTTSLRLFLASTCCFLVLTTASPFNNLRGLQQSQQDQESCFMELPYYRCFRTWEGAQLTAVCPTPRIQAKECACKLSVQSPLGTFVKCKSCHLYEYATSSSTTTDWAVDMDCSNVFVTPATITKKLTAAPTTPYPTRAPSHPPSFQPSVAPSFFAQQHPSRFPFLFGSSWIQKAQTYVQDHFFFFEDSIPAPAPVVELTMMNSRTRSPAVDPDTWHVGGGGRT